MIEYKILTAEHFPKAVALIYLAFNNSLKYSLERISHEVETCSTLPLKMFIGAFDGEDLVGVSGIKRASWASYTYIMFMTAVHPLHQHKGIGTAFIFERLKHIDDYNKKYESDKPYRVLVSTKNKTNFQRAGFYELDSIRDKFLMMFRKR